MRVTYGGRGVAGKLDMSEPVHLRMLQTVYQRLTGIRMDCLRYGSHWEDIGFQVHSATGSSFFLYITALCPFE
jgi:hypothetical protein